MARRKRKVSSSILPLQKQLPFKQEGKYFDLQEIFNRLNRRYFRYALKEYKIVWGRRRKLPPKEYFVFGSIQEEDRIIRIHPLLDASFVPEWFLEYVVYHEMLHSVVPDEYDQHGRRRVHTERFNRREQRFYAYRRARKWERENLGRFLR